MWRGAGRRRKPPAAAASTSTCQRFRTSAATRCGHEATVRRRPGAGVAGSADARQLLRSSRATARCPPGGLRRATCMCFTWLFVQCVGAIQTPADCSRSGSTDASFPVIPRGAAGSQARGHRSSANPGDTPSPSGLRASLAARVGVGGAAGVATKCAERSLCARNAQRWDSCICGGLGWPGVLQCA